MTARMRWLGVVLAVAGGGLGCGRVAPGATLVTRQDPYQPERREKDRTCVHLEPRKVRTRDAPDYDAGYTCTKWQTHGERTTAAVEAPAHPPGAGPAPPIAIVPTLVAGRLVSASGEDPAGAYWLEAQLSVAYLPRWDRIAPYASVGLLRIGGQDDLSGVSGGGGLMAALSASLVVEGHARVVRSDAHGRGAGGSLRYRPRHWTSHDWTFHVGLERVWGDDQLTPDPPRELVDNHATAVIIGASYGQVR